MNRLYTIGHSDHTTEHFVSLLDKHGVAAVADVRSSPYSRFAPQFNKETLQIALEDAHIQYVFLGRELGARRSENSCYEEDQARYARIKDLPLFRAGLDRLIRGLDQYVIALMCSEADPVTCHRTILICRELRHVRPDIEIVHILGDGNTETQADVEQRLVKQFKLEPELFGDLSSTSGLIEKAYDKQAERIAYRKVPAEA